MLFQTIAELCFKLILLFRCNVIAEVIVDVIVVFQPRLDQFQPIAKKEKIAANFKTCSVSDAPPNCPFPAVI